MFKEHIDEQVYLGVQRDHREWGMERIAGIPPVAVWDDVALEEARVRQVGALTPAGVAYIRDMSKGEQQNSANLAAYFNKNNPTAKRINELPAEYVVGDGLTYIAQDPKVQAVLDDHWDNDRNHWHVGQYDRCRDLGIFGEIFIPALVNTIDGSVELGHLDPNLIEAVIPDVRNALNPYAVIVKTQFSAGALGMTGGSQYAAYKVISKDRVSGMYRGLPHDADEAMRWGVKHWMGKVETLYAPVHSRGASTMLGQTVYTVRWAGGCFYTKVNSPMSAVRGYPDTYASMEWIEAQDRYISAEVQKAINAGNYMIDIMMKNASPQEVLNAEANDTFVLQPGGKFFHNDEVEVNIPSPDLHSDDTEKTAGVIKAHALSGVGIPPLWLGETGTARAAAPELTDPSYKRLRIRQRAYATLLSRILAYVIDTAIEYGYQGIDRGVDKSFYLKLPDVSAKDQRLLAVAMKSFADSLKAMGEAGIVEKRELDRLFRRYTQIMGIDAGRDTPFSSQSGGAPEQGDPIIRLIASRGGRDELHLLESSYYFYGPDRIKRHEIQEAIKRQF